MFLAGCAKRQAQTEVPPAPPLAQPEAPAATSPLPSTREARGEEEPIKVPAGVKPIQSEIGIASWYGPPYHHRPASNGKLYNMQAFTAAHRTLPLGSIVRVTNLKTEHSTLVRITDRGPFIKGRILDLSLAAAKQVDVWQAGLAEVRVDVLQAPAPLETGGRWGVQVGAFADQRRAGVFAEYLSRRYHTASVLCFASPTGNWWVRVRVADDDKKRAEKLIQDNKTSEGVIFLVRLD